MKEPQVCQRTLVNSRHFREKVQDKCKAGLGSKVEMSHRTLFNPFSKNGKWRLIKQAAKTPKVTLEELQQYIAQVE